MNKKVNKLKYKIEWLRLELEEVREVNAKCLERFFQDFAEVLTEDIEEKVVETLPEKKSFHAAEHVTSKLFKEIAVKTHPDKRKSKDEIFIRANKANEVNNLSDTIQGKKITHFQINNMSSNISNLTIEINDFEEYENLKNEISKTLKLSSSEYIL